MYVLRYHVALSISQKIILLRKWTDIYAHSLVYRILWIIPYSRKYWRGLNLAVEPEISFARILSDLNNIILGCSTGSPYVYMRVGNFDEF